MRFSPRSAARSLLVGAVAVSGSVVIGQGDPGTHLGNVGRGVKRVTLNRGRAIEQAQCLAHAGFAAAGNTHDDQGSDRLTHETPQSVDSAVFVHAFNT